MPQVFDEVWTDVLDVARWYERRTEGLGERVMTEFERALERVDDQPLVGTPWPHRRLRREVRRLSLSSFPLAIYYVTSPQVIVVAFADSRRRPGYWVERVERLSDDPPAPSRAPPPPE
jgi:toxin ParE1/3/4